MLHLSRKQILALESVLDVALHARPDPVQARDITDRQNVPQRYLEQIMQALVRADILRGVRGPKGGYRLARERRRIMVGDIIRVIAKLENNEEESGQINGSFGAGLTQGLTDHLQAELMEKLDKTSIAELCETVHSEQKAITSNPDFNI
ncbi:MAG: RrF2 family transcriptional regulator [Parvibaculales bacterium]